LAPDYHASPGCSFSPSSSPWSHRSIAGNDVTGPLAEQNRARIAEEKRAARLARKSQEREERRRAESNARHINGSMLIIFGLISLVAGLWYLLVEPGNPGSEGYVNLQRLTMGETFAIVGSVLFVGGLLLRYQSANVLE
jgi:hypothetical protein